ncbi:MAG: tetratricopeptide repeat protein [Nitrospirota bacterium]
MKPGKEIQEAFQYHKQGNLRKAEHLYQKILKKQPQHFDALHMLGILSAQAGNHELAKHYLKKALSVRPDSSHANFNLGNYYQGKGLLDKAIAFYQKAIQSDPHYLNAYCNLGICLREKGKIDEAIRYFQNAVRLDPGCSQAYLHLCVALDSRGHVDEAKDCFLKALQCNPVPQCTDEDGAALLRAGARFPELLGSFDNSQRARILLAVPVFNRKNITRLCLAQLKRYKSASCYLEVYNDHSTEYDNSFLMQYADEVIQLPDKMGIDRLRWFQMRKFLATDYELLYLTDNDALHDPCYLAVLEMLYRMGNARFPVCLFNSIFHMHPETVLCCSDEILMKKTASGISMLFDRNMVEKILSVSDTPGGGFEHIYPWDRRAMACLGLPWITPAMSYVEHYGASGVNNDNYEKDRAIFATPYLRERRDAVLRYLLNDDEDGVGPEIW